MLPYLDPALALLWRAPGVLQVGLDPARSWALAGAPSSLPRVLRRLVGQHPADDLLGDLAGSADQDECRRALGLLEDSGAVRHGDPATLWAQAWVEVVGDGPLAAVTRALLDGTVGRCSGADEPGARRADLVVLAPDQGRGLVHADGLMARGIPHLWLHRRDGRAVVGPLVHPGRTPCLRCTDLHRTDADDAWPRLVVAFEHAAPAGQSTRDGVAGATLAGAVAVGQVLRWLAGEPTASSGGTLEEQPDGSLLVLSWSTHPRCGCGWATTAAGGQMRAG